ncbi:hypothetical protein ACIBP6_01955 [Nonomuraea terrae]|uniref:hypothetical protein n=1 Tax=Nonomuraea terrae TaxID=2530383 RepID=UPI003790FB58
MSANATLRSQTRFPHEREFKKAGIFGRHRWGWLLAAGWLAQVAFRLLLSMHTSAPLFIPDETGYLLAARLFAGGEPGDLSGRTFYQGAYALLITPAFWLSDDPATSHRIALGINALISSAMLILAHASLRRLGISSGPACLAGHLIALLPLVVYYAGFALTDAVLPVVVLAWLFAIHEMLSRGNSRAYETAASGLAVLALSLHPRGYVIAVVQAAFLCVFAVRRSRIPRYATGTLLIGAFAAWAMNGLPAARPYPHGALPLGDHLLTRLTTLDGLAWTFGLSAGKLWYLSVGTWGLGGVGLIVLATLAFRRGTAEPLRVLAVIVLVTVAGIALATSAATPDEGTVATFVYGRHLACMAAPLMIAALAFALRARPDLQLRTVLGAVLLTCLTAAGTQLYAGERLWTASFGPFDFPEISFLVADRSNLRLWSATYAALLLLALAALLVRLGGKLRLIAAAGIMAVEVAACLTAATQIVRPWSEQLTNATTLSRGDARHPAVGRRPVAAAELARRAEGPARRDGEPHLRRRPGGVAPVVETTEGSPA